MANDRHLVFEEKEKIHQDTCIIQLSDGTLFYIKLDEPRDYTYNIGKVFGNKVDAVLPQGNYSHAIGHENALYFVVDKKIHKAIFVPARGIVVSFFRNINESETIDPDGLCYGMGEDGEYVSRICDNFRDIVRINKRIDELARKMIIAVYRGKVIFFGYGERPQARYVRDNSIAVELPWITCSSLTRDSSSFLYFGSGSNLFVLDMTTMHFLPTLQTSDSTNIGVIVGIHNGIITTWRAKDGSPREKSVLTTRLSDEYYQIATRFAEETYINECSSKFANEFDVASIRGEGGFGCVFEALHYLDKWTYAVTQIVSAVAYIHSKNLIHRDLKPSNVLFLEEDVLKLCDLGIATDRINEDASMSDATRSYAGTTLYMSPEQRLSNRYSSKTDVFTLGLILTELLVALTAAERSKIFDNYRTGVQNKLIADRAAANFVRMLTQVNPMDRPTCSEMLDQLFLA